MKENEATSHYQDKTKPLFRNKSPVRSRMRGTDMDNDAET